MSEKINPVPARKAIKVLESVGFMQVRQKGSHLFIQHPDGRTPIIPIHSSQDLGKGIVRKVL